MGFKFVISRPINFLFFAQKTNEDIRDYLSSSNTDLLFYHENDNEIWNEINKALGEQKNKEFKKTLFSLRNKFNYKWPEMSKELFLRKQHFESNNLLLQKVIYDFKKISGVKKISFSKIPVYLISVSVSGCEDINAWFSWTPKESFVIVEIPFKSKPPNNLFTLGVLAHEFFHLMIRENEDLMFQIKKTAEKNSELIRNASNECISEKMFIEELLVSSFIPEGYFSDKYFNIKVSNYVLKSKSLLSWRKLIAFKMENTIKEYINSSRQIDKNYFQRIIEIIKQNIK